MANWPEDYEENKTFTLQCYTETVSSIMFMNTTVHLYIIIISTLYKTSHPLTWSSFSAILPVHCKNVHILGGVVPKHYNIDFTVLYNFLQIKCLPLFVCGYNNKLLKHFNLTSVSVLATM